MMPGSVSESQKTPHRLFECPEVAHAYSKCVRHFLRLTEARAPSDWAKWILKATSKINV